MVEELKDILLGLSKRLSVLEKAGLTPEKNSATHKKTQPDDDDGSPLVRTPSGQDLKETRDKTRRTIFELIDAPLLAPEGDTLLFAREGGVGNFHFDKKQFVKIADAVMKAKGVPANMINIRALQELVRQRRNYHQRHWSGKTKTHARLRYGGTLGA